MEDLTEEQYRELSDIARRLCDQPQFQALDPDDVTQEAALRILSNPWQFRWRHVHQAAVDLLRKDRLREVPVKNQAHILDVPVWEDADVKLDVRAALGRLDVRQARVAVLYGMYGWPMDAAASRLDISPATAWRRWAEAKAQLALDLHVYRLTIA